MKSQKLRPCDVRRILVSEDYLPTRQALAFILRQAGWEVDFAQTGQEAFVALGVQVYDVLLVDVDIPPGKGWSVLEAWQAARHHPPVVALVSAEDRLRKRAQAVGVKVLLSKPVSKRHLLSGVFAALEDFQGRQRHIFG
jgi:DNA-binding response OmpR family regulator